MTPDRAATAGLLAATGGAGLLFAPVFGIAPLLAPVGLVLAGAYGAAEAVRARPRLEPWQLPLTAAAALVALLLTALRPTTRGGLPTAGTLRALAAGATDSWRLALQTTWPAGADPDVLLFVPLLVALAVLLGTAALRQGQRAVALLPGLAVAGLAQAYAAATGWVAAAAALGWAAAAAAVLGRPARADAPAVRSRGTRARAAARTAGTVLLPTAAAALLAAAALGAGSLAGRPAYELPRTPPVQAAGPVSNPLDEIAERLARPRAEAFRVRTTADVDRWQLAVLDRFDGATWTPGADYLRLGAGLPEPAAGPLRRGAASITLGDLSPPWLPSQRGTTAVAGVEPLVDAATGTLVASAPPPGSGYRLDWATPAPDAAQLRNRAVDPAALGEPIEDVPAGISDLAETAVRDRGASYGTALVLAAYLRTQFPLATGPSLPTGNGWPALQRFLLNGGGGTSEQFATAYVVLARVLGIPARVVVGYRQPAAPGPDGSYVVRNADVLAWPEVAVQGAGWVPVDPLPERAGTASPPPLPPPPAGRPRPPATPPGQSAADPGAGDQAEEEPAAAPATRAWLPAAGAVLVGVPLAWLVGVPAAKAVRRARRRRRTGPEAVVGAWLEARDQLRSYGVPVSPVMTVRDLAAAAGARGLGPPPPGARGVGPAGSGAPGVGPAGSGAPGVGPAGSGAPGVGALVPGPRGASPAAPGAPGIGAVVPGAGGPGRVPPADRALAAVGTAALRTGPPAAGGAAGGGPVPAGGAGDWAGPAAGGPGVGGRPVLGGGPGVGGGPGGAAVGGSALDRLARAVDAAVWSGGTPAPGLADEAWAAVADVRRDLAAGPSVRRVRAALDARSLFPPR